MIGVLIVLVVFFILLVFRAIKNRKDNKRRDYSLGMSAAVNTALLIKEKKYEHAEELVRKQTLNDRSQIIDHVALYIEEDDLKHWELVTESNLSRLCLGTFYLHMAWISRTHKLAKNVSNKKAMDFFSYLELCEESYLKIQEKSHYKAELCSRSIRLYMSLSSKDTATDYFNEVTTNHPNLLWPYLHYAEMIQPKWYGSTEEVIDFYTKLPNDFLIKATTTLKLILDAVIIGENYFKKMDNNLKNFAENQINTIDQEVTRQPIDSIHRYILYNYMEAIASHYNLKDMSSKYRKLKNSHDTIYPYGLIS
ncbi:hypothetical protein LX97_02818 [Nonlabens dokdonensis]|jgi:hypothetical protein|uniref:Uncharacterized protein n=2 Tax=Nonlabens dokdonensis TaxID=328515 RepID=L7WEE3_NONDD|nr:hypothetical protein [Nonlabens dokdonensis]AGC78494.1 hypothetical protein DDD_3367 [Nonlabens dokdonensis DSW-6]PZX38237.1 hypothetical protein LX97_02818 [Nonlabens dokdonensis]